MKMYFDNTDFFTENTGNSHINTERRILFNKICEECDNAMASPALTLLHLSNIYNSLDEARFSAFMQLWQEEEDSANILYAREAIDCTTRTYVMIIAFEGKNEVRFYEF